MSNNPLDTKTKCGGALATFSKFTLSLERDAISKKIAFVTMIIRGCWRVRHGISSKRTSIIRQNHSAFKAPWTLKWANFFNALQAKQFKHIITFSNEKIHGFFKPFNIKHSNTPIIFSDILIIGEEAGVVNPIAASRRYPQKLSLTTAKKLGNIASGAAKRFVPVSENTKQVKSGNNPLTLKVKRFFCEKIHLSSGLRYMSKALCLKTATDFFSSCLQSFQPLDNLRFSINFTTENGARL